MNQTSSSVQPDQRLARKYRFNDSNMDLFFVAALGWGSAGGLDAGQVFHIADNITDGDADSWVSAFGHYGDLQNRQADTWLAKGWRRAAGEARLKAFASYRSAWQFAAPGGEEFRRLYTHHQQAFATAMRELALPVTFFNAPYAGRQLPGVFLQHENPKAPVVLVIGGADTCFEDLFFTVGRKLFERGYSVALADLPGQGKQPLQGLYWEAAAEKPIASIIDVLEQQFRAQPGRIALLGLSLGGYFATRTAGYETRLATVMASTPFPDPAQLFAQSVRFAGSEARPSTAAQRSRLTSLWKAGAGSPADFIANTAAMQADPARVSVPFLSIVGTGDSPTFIAQAEAWHRDIRSSHKEIVHLDAASGADGHVQVANRLRLAQECAGWLDGIFNQQTGE